MKWQYESWWIANCDDSVGILNSRGDEGWELIDIDRRTGDRRTGDGAAAYLFKRPRPVLDPVQPEPRVRMVPRFDRVEVVEALRTAHNALGRAASEEYRNDVQDQIHKILLKLERTVLHGLG
jgi:hypothetical protein